MSPDKILYVDDEPMALKYFERLVSPLAPVITAGSVEEGKAVLRERGGEIAVLVTDQRMPGAYGNELLRFAREFHPQIVRMLTTAYSELGEAIEAINSGEIYRYITKPWELGSLHADLRNALELAELRTERDHLLGQKLMVQQQGLLGSRLASLVVLGAAHAAGDSNDALQRFARAALAAGCKFVPIPWDQWDHASLLQAEARRGVALVSALRRWQAEFGSDRTSERAFALLAGATQGAAPATQGAAGTLQVRLPSSAPLTALLDAAPGDTLLPAATGWLAWLLWWNQPVLAHQVAGVWTIEAAAPGVQEPAPPANWLECAIEELAERPAH
ncbi:MAG: response regulator [Polaromonas sp.]|nr:response regulator [Polaromonas sp.]